MALPLVPREYTAPPFAAAVSRHDAQRIAVKLDGRLPVDWAVRLTTGLTAARANIVKAKANREGPSAWRVEVVCVASNAHVDAAAVSKMLLDPGPMAPAQWPAITAFAVEPNAAGPCRLRVEAQDSVGFLGNLLRSLALHGVFPSALDVATSDDRVDDVLMLASIGQATLSPTAHATIEQMLRAALVE